MDNSGECCSCSTQLIDGGGTFNVDGLENFIKEVKLRECDLSYTVVSIMGPKSSGKSTLLNHLFGTDFREMDLLRARSRTTEGIWMAKGAGIEPCTLVMDLEGTDGEERRREDDTTFEKQIALFALAVSDIVLINMWCHDIGRIQAANMSLLKTLFQVIMRLFSPRKTTLLFVIRDKQRTSLEYLESLLREAVQEIWDRLPKPQAHKETPLSDFFNVEFVALSSYVYREEQFKEEVASLRQQFFHSTAPGGLAGDRRGVVLASRFSSSAQQMWKVIKENEDLHLPAHKVMVAIVRCEEIANEKYSSFTENEDWRLIEEAARLGSIPGFGKKLSSILEACLSGYELEAIYFEESVRSSKRKQLEEKLLQLVQPAFLSVLEHTGCETLDKFKEEFDKALNGGEWFSVAARDCIQFYMTLFDKVCSAKWDTSRAREKLRCDIDAHVASVHAAKLSELTKAYEAKLKEALSGPVEALLDEANSETWSAIRKLLLRETESAVTGISGALSGFDLDEQSKEKMLAGIKDYARGVVEAKARKEAGRVLLRMKDRFTTLFYHDADSMPRVWTRKEDIRAITKLARSASIKLLSVLAAVRLDDEKDNIEKTLSLSLLDTKPTTTDRSITMASSTWEECKSLWRQFKAETEYTVTQAVSAQV
ncbi:hypothetical protein BT93_J2009 [Corymbia citriodora subsp. variegata]|nr:hypothetical protein BT93_J2009 [Corymbia citriodora subsp. variegata]